MFVITVYLSLYSSVIWRCTLTYRLKIWKENRHVNSIELVKQAIQYKHMYVHVNGIELVKQAIHYKHMYVHVAMIRVLIALSSVTVWHAQWLGPTLNKCVKWYNVRCQYNPNILLFANGTFEQTKHKSARATLHLNSVDMVSYKSAHVPLILQSVVL